MARSAPHRLLALALALAPAALPAQDVIWTAAVGPSAASPAEGRLWRRGGQVFTGAGDVGGHAAVGASWAVPGWALALRGEMLYNRLVSPPSTYWVATPSTAVPRARRDETAALAVSAVFRARRAPAWAPYVLAGAGVYHSRLRIDADPSAGGAAGAGPHAATGAGYSYGAGLEVPVRGRAVFAEVRRHEMLGRERGSGFVPVSLGMRF